MIIKVISWSKNKPLTDSKTDFYLERDDWNDFSYYTYYHLHVSKKHTRDNTNTLIGGVKILKARQKKDEIFLIDLGYIDKLASNFCSLGQSLDYYERISQLNQDTQDYILSALNDIIYNPKIKLQFENEEAYRDSLLRYIDANDDMFSLAPILLSGDFEKLPDKDLRFSFNFKNFEAEVEFDFTSPTFKVDWSDEESLPDRISVIVGRNGSGKSTLMAKISKIVFASSNDRGILNDIGSIKPKGLGFPRIINISYSAFDTFNVPGIRPQEKRQISNDIKSGVGRYIFCGIRDICGELDRGLKKMESQTDEHGILTNALLNDKQEYNLLKPITSLTKEFNSSLKKISESKQRLEILRFTFGIISQETSLSNLREVEISDLLSDESFFSELSTGHKFVLHAITNIIQHVENRSLILFDEPETHLHPPLLAVLMKSLRFILSSMNSFMIVGTHSPVVVQETLSRHVYIIRREGNLTALSRPEIQTYGENIGIITSHVFELSSDITDYHEELDKVVQSFITHTNKSERQIILEKIEELFDGALSLQARGYIMSKINEKNEEA